MSKLNSGFKSRPQLIALAADQAVTVAARRGTEVLSLEGELWITHEGDLNDYVVPPGARFCSGARGRIVVSALGAPGRALLSRCDPKRVGEVVRSAVLIDYCQLDAVRTRAERLRADAIARFFADAGRALARRWQRLIGRPARTAPGLR